jgi:hypothetical protein
MSEQDRTQDRTPPETGVIVNGVNVRDMTDEQLTAAAEAAAAAGPAREAELDRAQLAYVQYRIVFGVLVYELDRRRSKLAVVSAILPNGKLVRP